MNRRNFIIKDIMIVLLNTGCDQHPPNRYYVDRLWTETVDGSWV